MQFTESSNKEMTNRAVPYDALLVILWRDPELNWGRRDFQSERPNQTTDTLLTLGFYNFLLFPFNLPPGIIFVKSLQMQAVF